MNNCFLALLATTLIFAPLAAPLQSGEAVHMFHTFPGVHEEHWAVIGSTPVGRGVEQTSAVELVIKWNTVTAAKMAMQGNLEPTGFLDTPTLPLVRVEGPAPQKENGKDFILDPDGAVRVWDIEKQRYRQID